MPIPAHASSGLVSCDRCRTLVRHNVPRLGPAGGFVHAESSQLECSQADLAINGAFEKAMTEMGCEPPFPYDAFQIFRRGFLAAESYGQAEMTALEKLVGQESQGASLPPDPVSAIGLIIFSRNERILDMERRLVECAKTPSAAS